MAQKIDLASHFEPPTKAQWQALAEKTLKGRPLESLQHTSEDGVVSAPLYTEGVAKVPRLASKQTRWQVLSVADAASFLTQVENAQDHGVQGVWLTEAAELPQTWPSNVAFFPDTGDLAASSDLLTRSGAKGRAYGGLLSQSLRTGEWADSVFQELAAKPASGSLSTLEVHNSGATAATELAMVLADAVSTAQGLQKRGADPAVWLAEIPVVVGVTTAVFDEISKVRALRWVLAKLAKALDTPIEPVIHVVAGRRSLASVDTWSNAIRATTQVFAGAVGGADRISVLRHDARTQAIHSDGERLASTSQHVLALESHLQQVADPAAGAWAIDDLTQQTAKAAWELFQSIQSTGGLNAYLASGRYRDAVQTAVEKREADYARRKRTRIGVNEFAAQGPVSSVAECSTSTGSLPLPAPYAEAQGWEHLQRTNRERGASVFLANLGLIPRHKARADFVTRLFQAGGFKVVGNDGFQNADDAAEAFEESGAEGFVLCGHDEDYPGLGLAVAAALKGARFGAYAGRPDKDSDIDWSLAGVDHFVFLGADVLEVLMTVSEVDHD